MSVTIGYPVANYVAGQSSRLFVHFIRLAQSTLRGIRTRGNTRHAFGHIILETARCSFGAVLALRVVLKKK